VACPICRSQLVVTPERVPRHDITFPFVPNRTVDAAVKDLVGKLDVPSAGLKRELGSSSAKRVKVKKEDAEGVSAVLDGWKTGGTSRKDWIKRERLVFRPPPLLLHRFLSLTMIMLSRQGREEMAYLTTNWAKLQGQDFILMKARLQV
jgi:hypothetical protein